MENRWKVQEDRLVRLALGRANALMISNGIRPVGILADDIRDDFRLMAMSCAADVRLRRMRPIDAECAVNALTISPDLRG